MLLLKYGSPLTIVFCCNIKETKLFCVNQQLQAKSETNQWIANAIQQILHQSNLLESDTITRLLLASRRKCYLPGYVWPNRPSTSIL